MGNISIKTKLATTFGVLLFFIVGIGVYAYSATSKIQSKSEEIGVGWMGGTEKLNAILSDMNLMRRRNILRMIPDDAAGKAKKDKQVQESIASINKEIDEYQTAVENHKYYKTDADKAAKLKLVADLRTDFKAYCDINDKAVKMVDGGDLNGALGIISNESNNAFLKLNAMLDAAIETNKKGAHDAVVDGEAVYNTTAMAIAVIVLLAFAIGLSTAVWIARYMNKSISELERVSQAVAGGNLTVSAEVINNDEFGKLADEYNQMIDNVRKLISQIHSSAQQVAAASEELTASSDQSAQVTLNIAKSITDVAAAADKQVTAVDKTTELIMHISAGVEETSATSSEAADKTADAVKQAKLGSETISQSVKQMESIAETVNDTAGVVTKLGERSKEIGNIVDTISGIAGQTNLLALNAAIEAARAGEHGKGFAVVAEEVRKLAEQSGEAAKRIEELINAIQVETEAAVTAMNNGTVEVKKGTDITHQAGLAFNEIMNTVEVVNQQSREIATTMEDLARKTEEVSEAGQQIDAATQAVSSETQSVSAATEEQSASMEEIASGSRSLADLAQELQMASEKFKI